GHSCSNSIDEDHYTSFDEEVNILNEQADMASDITPDDTDDDEEAYPRHLNGTIAGHLNGTIAGHLNGTIAGDLTGTIAGDLTGTIASDLTGTIAGLLTGTIAGHPLAS
ncbi:hypothetical protein GE061_008594, partial [Apolygus lucorum]